MIKLDTKISSVKLIDKIGKALGKDYNYDCEILIVPITNRYKFDVLDKCYDNNTLKSNENRGKIK